LSYAVLEEYLSDDWMSLQTVNEQGMGQLQQHPGSQQPQLLSSEALVVRKGDTLLTLPDLHHNIILTSLLLEGVGVIVQIVGKESVTFLEKSLYWLLMSLGSPTAAVSHSALHSLGCTATACGYTSLTDLIGDNSDYLVNTIALNLRHLALNPHAPLVVQVMLRYADHNTYPVFLDLTEDVFDVMDGSTGSQIGVFIGVLNALLSAMLRWMPALLLPPLAPSGTSATGAATDTTELGEGDAACPKGHDEETAPFSPPPDGREENAVPQPVQLVMDVLSRCRHFLGSSVVRHRLLVVETVKLGARLLNEHERQLLPTIHGLWEPLMPVVSDPNAAVAIAALELVQLLCEVCGDFLRQRVVKDVVGRLAKRLRMTLSEVRAEGGLRARSWAHKLTIATLHALGSLASPLQLGGAELEGVITSVIPFLHQEVPAELQDLATDVLKTLCKLDVDLVWFCLAQAAATPLPSSDTGQLVGVAWPRPLVGCGTGVRALLSHIEALG